MAVSVANSHIFCSKDQNQHQQWLSTSSSSSTSSTGNSFVSLVHGAGYWSDSLTKRQGKSKSGRGVVGGQEAFSQGAAAHPPTVAMEPITSMEHLDQILLDAQHQSPPQLLIIDWMAAWCRKCIYLKPKLEKLAAEYDTKLKFYYVDVNNVSQALVKRGNISKMPTIQLWKDGEMKEEVIGGHKAPLVIDEVREMIQKHI